MKRLYGDTYPHRHLLNGMGGKYDPVKQCWEMPDDKWQEAFVLVHKYPSLKEYKEAQQRKAKAKGFIITPTGRKKRIRDIPTLQNIPLFKPRDDK